ncbi:hypothetical protein [Candidatus Pristimantibacillus sp. PTI5]|uniref:hypothetical protein n=1 Tax=Candidatus Pristimantibacillus sp. PTI5 TaxID=3400422 RepID=UPI003B023C6F
MHAHEWDWSFIWLVTGILTGLMVVIMLPVFYLYYRNNSLNKQAAKIFILFPLAWFAFVFSIGVVLEELGVRHDHKGAALLEEQFRAHEVAEHSYQNLVWTLKRVPHASSKNGIDYDLFVGNFNKMAFQGDVVLTLYDNGETAETHLVEAVTLAPGDKLNLLSFETRIGRFTYVVRFDGHFLPNDEMKQQMLANYKKDAAGSSPTSVYFKIDDSGNDKIQASRNDVYLGNYGDKALTGELQLRFYFNQKLVQEASIKDIAVDPSQVNWVGKVDIVTQIDYYEYRIVEGKQP